MPENVANVIVSIWKMALNFNWNFSEKFKYKYESDIGNAQRLQYSKTYTKNCCW